MRCGHGLVLGKFLPPHNGHLHLIEKAARQCRRLSVVVGTLKAEPVDGNLRFSWMQKLCKHLPNTKVIHLTDENPQFPEDHPDFWQIWKKSLTKAAGSDVDIVFTSEEYGNRLASELNAKHVCVDPERKTVPVSGSEIRKAPYKNRQYLPEIVRPYFAKKIVITGPESTGKTTLTTRLARHFGTSGAHEYAREYFDKLGRFVEPGDFEHIYDGQTALEAKIRNECEGVFFCDTDLLVTKVYAYYYAGFCPDRVLNHVKNHPPDYSICLDIDTEWVADWQRTAPGERQEFKQKFIDELNDYNRNFTLISGSYEERFERAVQVVQRVLEWPFGYSEPLDFKW